ncbi:hypothetical protein AK812_SmicGene3839 [Symbiodinium microadriaticum]|uniref:Uncharacterized protein n=1 Tax=Symbiodinium microadriaticum TaxID=2951 RepID=A0A1Q9EXT8_SYMMI|nr:hypothetical protein AK812_SmicGene3839 [Symbiodinium microadriaticum]
MLLSPHPRVAQIFTGLAPQGGSVAGNAKDVASKMFSSAYVPLTSRSPRRQNTAVDDEEQFAEPAARGGGATN